MIDQDGTVERGVVADISGSTTSRSTEHPHVYKWQDLEQRYQRDHGTFYFGPTSHEIRIPAGEKYEPDL